MDRMYQEDNNINDKYVIFCMKYLESNSERAKYYKSKRKEKVYLVDKSWMNQFKNNIGFKKVMEEIKKRKIKRIEKEDIKWIREILEYPGTKNNKIENYSRKSLKESLRSQSEEYEILSEETYNLVKSCGYEGKEDEESENGYDMIIKNERQIIRIDKKTVVVFYKEDEEDNDQSEIIFKFESEDEKLQDKIINDFINTDDTIPEWLKMVGYRKNGEIINYKGVTFSINTNVNLKQTLIGDHYYDDEDYEISEREKKIKELISDFGSVSTYLSENKNFPQRIVKKVNKSSFVITTIESLAQILSFSNYFLQKKIKIKEDKIAGDFKDFIENLWNDTDEIFVPENFMIKLMEITDDEKLSLKEEWEPYTFYEFILDKLNKELNGVDHHIKKYFENFEKKYQKEDKSLREHIKKYIKDNNSIVSKIFNGIMKINSSCDFCHEDEKIEYKNFNAIDIDIYDFCNNSHLEGNSLTNFSVGELIEFYFKERKEEIKGKRKCPKCKKESEKAIETKIIELPNYLILRIDWGNFKGNKGFNCKLDFIKPGYEYLEVEEEIEVKENYLNGIAYNGDNQIENSVKFKLFSTIGYFIDDNNKLIYISKYRMKGGKWFNFWCNGKGKEKGAYTDNFTAPCLLFYEKI